MKPVIYGSLAARLARVPAVVNVIAGMGYVFTSSGLKARLLRPLIKAALHWLLDRPNNRVIVQNSDDVARLTTSGMVATDVSGCREIAHDGVTGLLVPARDAESLAGALERLARDSALRRRMGAAARDLVERGLSEDMVMEKTLALYRTLVQGPT